MLRAAPAAWAAFTNSSLRLLTSFSSGLTALCIHASVAWRTYCITVHITRTRPHTCGLAPMQAIQTQLVGFIESSGNNLSMVGLGVETQALAQRAQILIGGKVDELRYAMPQDDSGSGTSGNSTPLVSSIFPIMCLGSVHKLCPCQHNEATRGAPCTSASCRACDCRLPLASKLWWRHGYVAAVGPLLSA